MTRRNWFRSLLAAVFVSRIKPISVPTPTNNYFVWHYLSSSNSWYFDGANEQYVPDYQTVVVRGEFGEI